MENYLSLNPELEHELKLLREWIAENDGKGHTCTSPVECLSFFEVLADKRGAIIAQFGMYIYRNLTGDFSLMLRISELLYLLEDIYPSLAPRVGIVGNKGGDITGFKKGIELSQAAVISGLISFPKIGKHLVDCMRLPKRSSLDLLKKFKKNGVCTIGNVKANRINEAGYIILSKKESLNSEDVQLNENLETALDLCLLDESIKVLVIRGDFMDHPKYLGKRVFCSGINLTKLYYGEIPYIFYIEREFGFINKLFRGLYPGSFSWNPGIDQGIEKPVISVVDSHAIGGGCQIVLVSDCVVASPGTFFSIPASKEGFIPGLANLRIHRYFDALLARKIFSQNYKILANSEEGKRIVDFLIPSEEMDSKIEEIIKRMCRNGFQGIVSNRKATRIALEPIDKFLEYMVVFSREQAKCLHDFETIENIHTNWIKRKTFKKE